MMPIVATVPRHMLPGHAPTPARGIVPWRCLAMLVAILVTASPVRAQLATDDCNGLDFDVGKPVVVAKVVSTASKIHYVKSASENASCPAETDTCRSDAYLVPGDLVLANSLRAPHTCITYQSPRETEQKWINGWFPLASLAAVAPMRAPRTADWMGTWSHPGGEIRIEAGDSGKLAILAFADDGSKPFGKDEDDCQVRMQRVDALLIVEDNGSCGGAAVTFTGFYRRKALTR